MTDSFVTQCPHCQTSFRVSHAQLSVARGAVRCGSCLQVFNAARQLLEQRSHESAAAQPLPLPVVSESAPPSAELSSNSPPEPIPTPAQAPRPAEPWGTNALDLDHLDLDEELARLEQRPVGRPQAQGREPRDPDSSLQARRDDARAEGDDWVDSLHNDDVDRLPEVQAQVIHRGADSEPEPEHQPEKGRTEPSFSASAALDDEPTAPETAQRKISSPDRTQRFSALDEADDSEADEPLEDPRGKRQRAEPAVRDQPLPDLTDDPLRLDWQPAKPRTGRKLLWTLLAVLALLGLAGQYVWYHFDELARQDQYRPWFQLICPQINCKVPSKVDITQLKSSNLVVRSHPEFKGALVVDAIIYNRASFSQPFPLLELRFADTSGQLIASRRFKPGEYLSGEIAGKEEMPPQTPIHIALDILDPGAKAVNYSLSFRSPE
jgi:predicted Zn finger-like uncharacterized protein